MVVTNKYLSLIKFSHTIFAMPFAMIGFFLALLKGEGNSTAYHFLREKWYLLLLVVLCMIFARSAAMAFNRYLDRNFDAKNPRTAIREIPAGLLKANSVLLFTIINSMLFIACTWCINPVCFYLSPVALAVVLGYSYTKRFTLLCHLVLGVGLSLAPIGAYLAVRPQFSGLPVLFSLSVIFWVSGFDIIYALQDEAFDKNHQLHSIPAQLGKRKALIVSRLLHVVSTGCIVAAGIVGSFGALYWAGVAVFAGMLIYQQRIVKADDLRRVNRAFMTANGMASVLFAVLVIADLITHR